MNWYNGFSPEQRNEAQAWLNKAIASGEVGRAEHCCLCGNAGVLDYHAEDYSKPFGPHLYRYPICYVCHMMLHCRKHDRARWQLYVDLLREGFAPEPFDTRNWDRFKRLYLQSADLSTSMQERGQMTSMGLELLAVLNNQGE